MKKVFLLVVVITATLASYNQNPDAVSGATSGYKQTGNSLYHCTEETSLKVGELLVEGEVENPGKVSLESFYKREVFCKEAKYDNTGEVVFVGAYRYSGYSLFDLLNGFILKKKNKDTFRPEIDVYIIIENDRGEKVTFSWAEIFFTNIPHQVIIATESAPIEPHRLEVDYPTGLLWKVVSANDLVNGRVLENPVRITVKTFDKKEYTINRELRNSFSPHVDVVVNNQLVKTIEPNNQSAPQVEYKSVFYGMGMGYHPIPVFKGIELQTLIEQKIVEDVTRWMASGLVCFAGIDGYRVIYSYSELFNRVDQVKPILATPDHADKSGYYRIYHPGSFYADMSAKSLAEIYFFLE